jgi:hypothetical protein
LRHYSTSWKVAVSILDEATVFFNSSNPSSRTMVLGSTQPLTEMSTRDPPGGKGRPAGRRVKLTSPPPSVSRLSCLENVAASMSHSPIGVLGLLQGQLHVFFFLFYTLFRTFQLLTFPGRNLYYISRRTCSPTAVWSLSLSISQ